jgi:hypothetical protein
MFESSQSGSRAHEVIHEFTKLFAEVWMCLWMFGCGRRAL